MIKHRYIFLLLLVVACSNNNTTGSDPKDITNSGTLARDTAVFPNKQYPIRIIVAFGEQYRSATYLHLMIKNLADTAVDISKWRIYPRKNGTVLPFRYKNLETGYEPTLTSIKAQSIQELGGTLGLYYTEGDTLDLLAPNGELTQRVIWRNVQAKQSVFPFRKNTAKLRIYYAIPNPVGADAQNEKVVVQNVTADTVSTTDWTLRSTDAGGQKKFLNERIPRLLPYQKFTFIYIGTWLNNLGDNVELVMPDGKVVHVARWGDVSNNEGFAAYPED